MRWLRQYWIVLILVGFLIAIFDVTISTTATCHPPAKHSSDTTQPQKDDECTALRGPILTALEWSVDFMDSKGEAVTAVFTIVLAFFTAALWRSTDKLWAAGERQMRLTRAMALNQQAQTRESNRIAAVAADAAKINADAAKQSAEVAERAFTHTRTPAIGFSCHEVSEIKAGARFGVSIHVINVGRGAAYDVGILTNCEIFPIERLKEPFKIPMMESESIIIPAQDKVIRPVHLKGPLITDDVDKIKADKAAMCIWGVVTFSDDGKRAKEPFSYVFTGTRSEFGECQIIVEEEKAEDQTA